MFHAEDPFYMTDNDKSSPYVDEFQNSGMLPVWGFALAIVLPTLALLSITIGAFVLIRRRQRDRKIQEEATYANHIVKNRYSSKEMEEQRMSVKNLHAKRDSSSQMPLGTTVGGVGSTSAPNEKINLSDRQDKSISSSSVLNEKSRHKNL
jgi:uncharacterized membrane protein